MTYLHDIWRPDRWWPIIPARTVTHPALPTMIMKISLMFLGFSVGLMVLPGAAQSPRNPSDEASAFDALEWRMIGPYRGGRSTAITGIAEQPHTFFMGTTGGGVWRSDDAGQSWANVSDGYFGGSIGAIDVADSDHNVIYVGTGSACIRGNASTGHGAYRSTDGGRTWSFVGLPEAGVIGRIVVHPRNPDLVYVAALGHPFGQNRDRGVYRSTDGGASWEQVLYLSDSTGAVDLSMNRDNPRVIYAGMWRGERKPWALLSGSAEAGVYRTVDGGDTWTKLEGGLPTGIVGKVGVTVSPANPRRVWAILEAEPEGGVYRSDDGGDNWERVNSENNLRQRAWYYTHIEADPQDENTVYVLNTGFYRSVDGGRTFESIPVPHGDMHDVWINPLDPHILAVGDDGGGQVSVTNGRSWSSYYNQPTAELYDVVADNAFPYRVYAAQQDNTTISVTAWYSSNTLYPKEHWYSVGGCETGPVALHPDHPDIVYAGCYGGVIDRFDRTRQQIRNVVIYPELQLGQAARDLKYRFQWNAAISVSPHDPSVVYHGSQYVHRSRDGGMSWETLSGDLTTNTPEHQDFSGGPINRDITGVEIFDTIYQIVESPHERGVIWVGSDDGRIHLSRDNGATWTDVTPDDLPPVGTVNRIEVSPHDPATAYAAVHRYRLDDYAPYVFRTEDYGRSWERLTDGTNGIPADYPVRVVREDPVRRGLLYAGTEFGAFVSFDAGRHWQSLQLNLPVTPVTGLQVVDDDLVASTQGRSFWVLDDITPLREWTPEIVTSNAHLFAPRPAYRVNSDGSGGLDELAPQRLPGKSLIHYWLGSASPDAVLEVVDDAGRTVRAYYADSARAAEPGAARLPSDSGMHRITWDLTYPGPELEDDAVLWGYTGGVKAPPGTYHVRLQVGDVEQEQPFEVRKDPRLDNVTQAEFDEQFRLAMAIRDTISMLHHAIGQARGVREQIVDVVSRASEMGLADEVRPPADSINANLTSIEESLIQVRSKSGQDPIRFAGMMDNQYVALYENVTGVDGYRYGGAEGRPTPGDYQLFEELNGRWITIRARLQLVLERDLRDLNELLARLGVPAIAIPGEQRPVS